MRNMRYIILAVLPVLLLLSSCNGRTEQADEAGDTLLLRHARNLTIVEFPDRTEVTLLNPWDGTGVLASYVLVDKSKAISGKTNSSSQSSGSGRMLVAVPLHNAAVFGSVHCALIHDLGADEAIGGICDLEYINQPELRKAVAVGRVANLGNSIQPSLEKLVDLSPDALMPSPFENSGGLGRIERLGIPIIWCADYMEHTPLGRAEWMRFYGRLFGRGEEADSIFSIVEQRYEELAAQAKNAKTKPRLLPEMPWSGQWTLPGAGSSSTKLYEDAGADYLFANLEGNGGIPLSTEKVVDKGIGADIWLIKHHGRLDRRQMVSDTPLLASIKAPIWWCDTSQTLLYEETPFHPERLLENLISILHPELGITSRWNYFKLLEE